MICFCLRSSRWRWLFGIFGNWNRILSKKSAETFWMIDYEIMVKMNGIKRQILRHMMFFLSTVQQRNMSRIFLNLSGGSHIQSSPKFWCETTIWHLWFLSNIAICKTILFSRHAILDSLEKRKFPTVILKFSLMLKHLRILRFPLFCNLFSKI